MLEKFIVPAVVGTGTLILSALGVDIYMNRKTGKRIDMSVKEMRGATSDRIQESILRKAVSEAADSAVADYMNKAKNETLGRAREMLNDEVRKAVKEASAQIKKEVSDRVATEASLIDMSDLKKSAREKAEAKILEKFDGNLEDLLTKFNDNLSNVQKIYGGIADAIKKTNEKSNGINFSLS